MTETIELAPLDALNAAMAGHACDVVRADGTVTRLNVQQWTSAPERRTMHSSWTIAWVRPLMSAAEQGA